MTEIPRMAAFTGGELYVLPSASKTKDVVLAVPVSRLLVKFVHVPPGQGSTPEELSAPLLKSLSPFPDEELTVSCETMHETEDGGKVVMAVALPESAAEDIGEKLDEAKLNVVRIDALPLGMVRSLLPRIGEAVEPRSRVVYLEMTPDGVTAIVFDGSEPVSMRSFGADSALKYEVMLSLMEAEDFAGQRPVKAIFASGVDASPLAGIAPVTEVEGVTVDEALEGIAARSLEPGALNAMPASWREILEETRFKAKLVSRLVVAGAIWVLAMCVLFGVPTVYGFMSDHQRVLIREHRHKYEEVQEKKQKVELISKYSNHDGGALEVMRVVSECVPDCEPGDFVVESFSFERNKSVSLAGNAGEKNLIYAFKNNLARSGAFSDVGTPKDRGASKDRHGFSIEMSFPTEDDAQ